MRQITKDGQLGAIRTLINHALGGLANYKVCHEIEISFSLRIDSPSEFTLIKPVINYITKVHTYEEVDKKETEQS